MSIINLTAKNFTIKNNKVYVNSSKTANTPGILLIWADFCGHCHTFIPKFKEMSRTLGSEFKCTAIEHSELQNDTKLSSALDFQYFPTIKFFDQNGKIIGTYPADQKREISDLMAYICKIYHHCIMHHD
jgi:thiol-disulfide isomerase/thioredoxin